MRMVMLGDSVVWGQGLLPECKFSTLVYKSFAGQAPDPENFIVLAHSGATIGASSTIVKPSFDGEVPDSYPTIVQQCSSFNDRPDAVDIVILNGGINDVGAATIVDPLTDEDDLKELITKHCYQDMLTLLKQVTAKFSNPNTKIIVPGYFPILSTESDLAILPHFLGVHGVSTNRLLTGLDDIIFRKIFDQCALFFNQSNANLNQAVADVMDPRVRFAPIPFQPANAALAPDAWLWGINDDLTPEDQVIGRRHAACDLYEADIIQRETCYRASVGHPNVIGAQQFANAIINKLNGQ